MGGWPHARPAEARLWKKEKQRERGEPWTTFTRGLANRLDQFPNGFPETESGVELKILRKIFSPEEAEMALKIRPLPETAEQIAERLGKPAKEMESILDDVAKKGQIGTTKMAGQQAYMLFPFVVGIYEFSN